MSLKYGEIIKQMSLEEKALMMSGKNTWETVDFEKYGIPSMAMSDGPHGLRRQAGAGDHLGLNALDMLRFPCSGYLLHKRLPFFLHDTDLRKNTQSYVHRAGFS